MNEKLKTSIRIGKTVRVLYAEDEKEVRENTKEFLQNIFEHLDVAKDGKEALEYYKDSPYDLLITDLEMPRLHGTELIEACKALKPETKVIVSTAYSDKKYLLHSISFGVDAYITKPVKIDEFIDAIHKVLVMIEQQNISDTKVYETERQKTIMEQAEQSANIGSWEYVLQSKKTSWSPQSFKMFNMKENSAISPFELVSHISTEDARKRYESALDALIKKGVSMDINVCLKKSDNDEQIIHITGNKNSLNEQSTLLYGAFHDVTKKELLIQVEHEKESARYYQEKFDSMTNLLQNIAHQWRQPLNGIALLTEQVKIFLESHEYDEIDTVLENILSETGYLTDTITKFSKLVSVDAHAVTFYVAEVCKKVVELFETSFDKSDITLQIECDEKIECQSKPSDILRILVSLMTNSIESIKKRHDVDTSHRGELYLRVTKDNNVTSISVADNGVGIEKEMIDKIFEPYVSSKFSSRGVGLSLYFNKYVAEKELHGELVVDQYVKEGAKFTLILPDMV